MLAYLINRRSEMVSGMSTLMPQQQNNVLERSGQASTLLIRQNNVLFSIGSNAYPTNTMIRRIRRCGGRLVSQFASRLHNAYPSDHDFNDVPNILLEDTVM